MKTRMKLLSAVGVALAIAANMGWAQGNYVPKPNEELYGTWTNEKCSTFFHVEKQQWTPEGGYSEYYRISDSVPSQEGKTVIDSKRTDSEGNIWYKCSSTVTTGEFKGQKFQSLTRLSDSGKVLETVWYTVQDFKPDSYPTAINPKAGHYLIFYHVGYVPKPNEELYGTWINQGSPKKFFYFQKMVFAPGGWQSYSRMSDSAPSEECTWGIDSKWTDSEGNIWYRIFNTIATGQSKGVREQDLMKLSESGTVLEIVISVVTGEFDANSYPANIDPKEPTYSIFHRASE